VPNKSHLFVVAERTRTDITVKGGCTAWWTMWLASLRMAQRQGRDNKYPLTLATKATILGHTLRGQNLFLKTRRSPSIWPTKPCNGWSSVGGGRGLYDGLS
jgi:hypothetical protein